MEPEETTFLLRGTKSSKNLKSTQGSSNSVLFLEPEAVRASFTNLQADSPSCPPHHNVIQEIQSLQTWTGLMYSRQNVTEMRIFMRGKGNALTPELRKPTSAGTRQSPNSRKESKN